MLHREVILPPKTDPAHIESLVEVVCRAEGLGIGLKAPVREYPGSTHWHWKRARENGTLEVTHWPLENRLWISVHENRASVWTDAAVVRLQEYLHNALGAAVAKEMRP